ncbi:hypothetical protein EOD42_22450 [Rhodovarius crocodyli]|uniref:Uncharacterized protein n=1 Tax=Rhodovarius crocodyli TaxID=1979269 RepID=A0A437M128_9PROT|nr:hypothetical protein [Rhodovarius crocodyli]RVT91419.1 hypothetical protein EOD42_22450 [Rhodovarius crocodyli]
MFALLQAHPAGNAVRVILAPPSGAASWRVLRRTTDTITGPDDTGAVVVAEWGREEGFTDIQGLLNGTEVYYAVFYRDAAGAEILPRAPSAVAIPSYTARDTSVDVLAVLSDRFSKGLAQAVDAGKIRPKSGRVQVLCAPFVDPGKTELPMVTIHLDSQQPSEFGLSGLLETEPLEGIGSDETEGNLTRVTVNIIAVSLNPDERNALGRLLSHIVVTNLDIFEQQGLQNPTLSVSHTELLPETNAAALYLATASFNCLASSDATAAGVGIETVITALESTNG